MGENMDLYADLQGVPGAERPERYRRLLEMTGLAPFTRRRAGALSGGMKQKLGLACALIKSPKLLLLDEPTVGVDPVSRRELWKIVYELVEKDRIGVLVSTAYLDEAERCSRWWSFMRGGCWPREHLPSSGEDGRQGGTGGAAIGRHPTPASTPGWWAGSTSWTPLSVPAGCGW